VIDKIISHYKVIEKLGEGGMGEVYLAEDLKLERKVAIKFLPQHLTKDKENLERFEREAKAAAALNHPNIVTIYEIAEDDDQTFIVMEYIDGESLRDKINRGISNLDEIISLCKQICEGLQEAHKAGIVHRDIKPENILIDKNDRVKILDFGLAKLKGVSKLTKETSTLGTIHYMSPEQIQGIEVDHRSDIWSLGVVLYEMLTGELPFKGDYEQAVTYAILNEDPQFETAKLKAAPDALVTLLKRLLIQDLSLRASSVSEFKTELIKIHDQLSGERKVEMSRYFKPKFIVPVGLIVLLASLFFIYQIQRMNRIRWAKDVALPKIQELISAGGADVNNIEAYNLAMEAADYIPKDPVLKKRLEDVTGIISVTTEPPGVKIYRKPFNNTEQEWKFIGVSPIDSMRMPAYLYHWKFEMPGYETLYRQFWSRGSMDFRTGKHPAGSYACTMIKQGSQPDNMIYIPETDNIPAFFINKYEVTNKQFKEFIDRGGYQNKNFWKIPFLKNSTEISWQDALREFRDATGRPGPAPWVAGSYPEGEDNMPVNGISWYEAAAYAEFAEKSLPTVYHWGAARKGSLGMISHLFYSMCNFGEKGPVPIGTTKAMTQFGVYDMAGNVREWCWNESDRGRCIRGGAWNDVHYMYSSVTQADQFDRSLKNGIRCVIYPEKGDISDSLFASIKPSRPRDFYKEKPVSDKIFEIYKDMFSYDKVDLNVTVEETKENPNNWIHEKISFSAAYENERILIHLFLPKNSTPPYQTVIYFPGSGSVFVPSSKDIEEYYEFSWNLSYLVKNGRAVVYPVYKGTFERQDGIPNSLHYWYNDSHEFRDYQVKIVKDFKRVIDYLETRPDIDTEKLAYYGFSWGGILGSMIPAVEDRIKIAIINAGGLEMYYGKPRPEIDYINYVSRVTIPTLMLHGRYDANVSFENAAKPMFDLLGTPDKDKKLIVYETDHIIPMKELIKESLNWLDRYFGPVER
jgi:eukaryotic-like serine/threonine-protein kinase